MKHYTMTLPALLLAVAVGVAGCGKDEPETKAKDKNFGAGLGQSYNQMLDEARKGADAANQHSQDVEQRVRDAQ